MNNKGGEYMKIKWICKHEDGLDDCKHCEYEETDPNEIPCKDCLHNHLVCNFLPKHKPKEK